VIVVRAGQLCIAALAAAIAPFFFGSVDLFFVVVLVCLLSLGGLGVFAVPLERAQQRLLAVFLGICLLYAAVAVIQFIPNLYPAWNDAIWRDIRQIVPDAVPRIASRAEIPAIAVGHFALFALAFLNGFCVGTSRRHAALLFWFVQGAIALYAIYGLVALTFFPKSLLWIEKVAYLESLTSTFVNRNTAASLVGTGAILWTVYVLSNIAALRRYSVPTLLILPVAEVRMLQLALGLAGFTLCFLALVQTGSRGGLLLGSIGIVVAIALAVLARARASKWQLIPIILLLAVGFVAAVLNLERLATHGLFDDERWRMYRTLAPAILSRPWLGFGAGSFAEVFPAFRSAEMGAGGIWEMAHSTVLEIAFEMGIPMAVIIVAAMIAGGVFLMAQALKSRDDQNYLAAVAGILIFASLHAMIDFSLQVPGYLTVFAVVLGCGLAQAAVPPLRRRRQQD
jgi:O-antigen ligase